MNTFLLAILGTIGGAIAGFLIGNFFESRTLGACPLFCNPKVSTVFFAIIGLLLASGGK
ncbi:MAG: hypothetical protein M1470_06590 [Bacteroidetes bacterium]|nr:hypothetical protein [Bacteroidota bacterium]MCL5739176.1 hypothetical protein [Bacteroidota bacterium]